MDQLKLLRLNVIVQITMHSLKTSKT